VVFIENLGFLTLVKFL